jgi:uncharacterized protein (DUF1684 family)
MLADKSPLDAKDKQHFTGLNYFAPDTAFKVTAKFIEFGMPRRAIIETNTERRPEYEEIGRFEFVMDEVLCSLLAYRIPGDTQLFVPFTDLTNGDETYPTGRYLDIVMPEGENAILDFNLAYNPYCAYNSRYSCPIPPHHNKLDVKIRAGERKFHN